MGSCAGDCENQSNKGSIYEMHQDQQSHKAMCEQLLHSFPVAICIVDLDGHIKTSNEKWRSLVAIQSTENSSVLSYVSQEEKGNLRQRIQRIISESVPSITFTLEVTPFSGFPFIVECTLSLFNCGSDNNLVMCQFKDRSIEAHLETSLQKTYNRLLVLTEGIHDLLFELNIDGEITFVNKGFHGYSRTDLQGVEIVDLLPENIRNGWRQAFSRKQLTDFQFKFTDGNQTRYYGARVKFVDDGTENCHAVLTLSDDTESFLRTEELLKHKRMLQQSVEAKDKFLSIMAHDLKGPFSALISFGQLLSDTMEDGRYEKAERLINLINESALHSYNLLENLLTWSRAQRGQISPSPTNFSIHEAITDTFELLHSVALGKNISFKCITKENTMVYADYNMVKTVLRNLVSNAVKYTHADGNISTEFEVIDNYVHVHVSDNGTGMRPEVLDSLFKVQKPKSQPGTEKEKGTGLGLLVCKEFVQFNKGEISVSTKLGEGSTFSFTLPFSEAN